MDEIARQFATTLGNLAPDARGDDSLVDELYEALDLLESSDTVSAVFPAIFGLFEKHPNADFGMPGPLVHLLEGEYPGGYEDLLLESLARKPVPHTVWMANRLLNSSDVVDPLRVRLQRALKNTVSHPSADEGTRRDAAGFIEHQRL
ncbi:MAG: hypothetical protein K0U72_03040 [Gammaproteobacteria bacterium]|nr:hypothetical protein [Gammaproteobacteria bacterium]